MANKVFVADFEGNERLAAPRARGICHVAYHVGQIVTLTQLHAGPACISPSVSRGQPAESNSNPTLE